MRVRSLRFCAMSVLLVVAAEASARDTSAAAGATTVAASARPSAAVVDAFHAALRRGDTTAALSYLADDALIFEEGGVERGKAEYAASHLAADAAFSKAVSSSLTRRVGHAAGALAWVATEGRTSGTFRGRSVDRRTVETMVLRRTGGRWKIIHIHWSSAAAEAQ